MAIVPVPKSTYLCDFHVGHSDGRADLYGLFNAMRPRNGFPYVRSRFCVFAQLTNGLGKIPFRIDIRSAENDELVWATETRELTFETRHSLVQVAMYIQGCRFERPGVYLVELFCDNIWVSDTELLLR